MDKVSSDSSNSRRKIFVILVIIGVLIFLCTVVLAIAGFIYLSIDKKEPADFSAELDEELSAYTEAEFVDENIVESEKYGEILVNELIIVTKSDTTLDKVEEEIQEYDGTIVGELEYINLYQVSFDISTEFELVDILDQLELVEGFEMVIPNSIVYQKEIKGVPCSMYEDVYSGNASIPYQMIGYEQAWKYIKGSGVELAKVKLGVVDDGLNEQMIDKSDDVKFSGLGKNDYNNDNQSHGTAVANVIGGSWDNSGLQGVAGGLGDKLDISFSNVFGKKTQNKVDKGEEEDLTTVKFGGKTHIVNKYVQIYKQIKNGATVINYSLGPKKPSSKYSFSTKLDKKFLEKVSKKYPKVLFVAAAGNEAGQLNGSNYGFGGLSQQNIITVGALNNNGANASFTNTAVGSGEITLAAGGVDIPVAFDSKGNVIKWNGTSFATPQVSGAAAVLQSINPDLTANEIKDILISTANSNINNPLVSDKEVKINQNLGGKVLRLDNAVLEVLKNLPDSKRPNNLDKDFLLGLFVIEAEATQKDKDPLGWDIIATIDTLTKEGTQVSIDYQGDGQLVGKSSETLEEAGSIDWIFGFLELGDETTIVITREDTQACTRLLLGSAEFYTGTTIIPVPDFPGNKMTFSNTKVEVDNSGTIEYSASGDDKISITEEDYTHEIEYDMILNASGPINKPDKSFQHEKVQGEWKFDFVIYFDPELVAFLGMDTYSGSVEGLLTATGSVGKTGIKGKLKLYETENNTSLFETGTFSVNK